MESLTIKKTVRTYIKNTKSGMELEIEIVYDIKSNTVSLASTILGDHNWSGVDLLDCFNKMREFVEKKEFLMLTNGSRKNTWPSGFLRDSSNGLLTYLVEEGIENLSTLNIFEYSDKDIVSIEKQIEFHRNWLEGKK